MVMDKLDYMLEQPQKIGALTMEQSSIQEVDQQEIRLASARLAMFVDTDGFASIRVTQRSRVRFANLTPEICMINTNRDLITWADHALTMLEVPHYIYWHDYSGYKKSRCRKIQGRISVLGCKRMSRLIPHVLPYMIGKKRQVELIKEFIDSRLAQGHKAKYTDRELEIANAVRGLNDNKSGQWRPVSSETVRQAQELVQRLRSAKIQSELHGDMQSMAEMSYRLQ